VARESLTFIRLLRHFRFADAIFARGALGVCRQALRLPRLPPCIEGADNSLGNNSVTRMNNAPSMNNQYGASGPDVKTVLA